MGYLLPYYYAVSTVILIIIVLKTDIKIFRVLVLSFLPIVILSFLSVLINIVYNFRVVNPFILFVSFFSFMAMLYFPFYILSAIFVKLLRMYNLRLFISAILGTILNVSLIYICFGSYKMDVMSEVLIPLSYFISVIIEDKLFKGKK